MKTRCLVLGAALTVWGTASLAGQAVNPTYLRDMPTVERVKQAFQAADQRETALMQMGAFWQLQEVIKTLAGPREFGELTPDEQAVMQSYRVAEFEIGQAIDKAFPGPYRKAQKVSLNSPYRFARTDPRFGAEGIPVFKTLLSPAILAAFDRELKVDAARHQAFVDAQARAFAEAQAREKAAAQAADPGTLAAKRCIEAGRDPLKCATEAVGSGLNELLGMVDPSVKVPPATPGPRLNGIYKGNGFALTFGQAMGGYGVAIACGALVPDSHDYTVQLGPSSISVTIKAEPKPIEVSVRPDGRMAVAGTIDVVGRVVVGTRTLVGYGANAGQVIEQPIYGPKTERCTPGVLTVSSEAIASGAADTGVGRVINAFLGTNGPLPTGFRMVGAYADAGGFNVEFHPENVIVGCRDASAAHPYTVAMNGSQLAVTIDDKPRPIVLTLRSDGSLLGAGSVEVRGRAAVGATPNNEIAYVPRNATCNPGVLAPKSQ